MEPILRPTARVLLVDGRGRTLLFRMVSEDFGDTFWFPPGGGLEADETHHEAALRELTEETGWTDPEVSGLIGYRSHVITWGGVLYDCREHWFLARVEDLVIDISGFTELEKLQMSEPSWWTVEDMRSTTDRMVPKDLANILERILTEGLPEEPLQLGT